MFCLRPSWRSLGKATLTVLCTLSVSPAQHPEVSADTLAAAGGTEATDTGGRLQD